MVPPGLSPLARYCGASLAKHTHSLTPIDGIAGTFPSEDEWEVTTPISIVEWFYNFYQETDKPGRKKAKSGNENGHENHSSEVQRPIECVLRPGDMIFIPNGTLPRTLYAFVLLGPDVCYLDCD